MTYSAVLTEKIFEQLREHLVREDGQEDLCFALWHPSNGSSRISAILSEVILPEDGDRAVHGNASFSPQYFERALRIASEKGAGLAFLHSHPYPGWQGMSVPDVKAEVSHAPAAFGVTGRPLVGLTMGTDGSLSARFWNRTNQRVYERSWCENVRVVGQAGIISTYNDRLIPVPSFGEELTRTISAWGEDAQRDLSRVHVGIVGLGSVGASVAEILARTGIRRVTFIDFDRVDDLNLDRHLHATRADVGSYKIEVVKSKFLEHSTVGNPEAFTSPYGITEEEGFRTALNCDVLFSCVDRPWARHVLNFIANAHLIPVFDGGISVHTKPSGKLHSADWKSHVVYPGNPCLSCLNQYSVADVQLEREGMLDDPEYIASLKHAGLKSKQNVYAFSSHLASMAAFQFFSHVIIPNGLVQSGGRCYHFVTGSLDLELDTVCAEGCVFPQLSSLGDDTGYIVTGKHAVAEESRNANDHHATESNQG